MSKNSFKGYITRSKHSPLDYTAPGRAAADSKFWEGIPKELPIDEQRARYEAAKRAHFIKLANKRWSNKRKTA